MIVVMPFGHTPQRADAPGLWQSVTGSQDEGETLVETAIREVRELHHNKDTGNRACLAVTNRENYRGVAGYTVATNVFAFFAVAVLVAVGRRRTGERRRTDYRRPRPSSTCLPDRRSR